MGDRLQLGDVERLPVEALEPLITECFDDLVTVAIADATNGYIPQRTRRLLRRVEWRLDWQDALLCAAAELQVAVERMRYQHDPRLDANEYRLRRVRARSHEAAILAKKLRNRDYQNSTERKSGTSSRRTAEGWLRLAFPDEYNALVEHERACRNLADEPPAPAARDVHDQIAHATATGLLPAPRTPAVDALLGVGETALRNTVADDARNQEDRNPVLRHPLLLGRWEKALTALGTMAAVHARAESPHALGELPAAFYALPYEEAIAVLNARRFLAAVQQRRIECKRCIRQTTQTLRQRERTSPRAVARAEAKAHASELLREAHPAEYDFIRAVLRPHEHAPGALPLALVSSPRRAEIKRHVLTTLADGTWTAPPSPHGPP